jgi:hypothetical protein
MLAQTHRVLPTDFGTTPTNGTFNKTTGTIRRAGTLIRSPTEARREREKEKTVEKDLFASEVSVILWMTFCLLLRIFLHVQAFSQILDQIAPQLYREEDFIADFLQINDAALTYANYMGLDNYFRRQAARAAGLGQPTVKLLRNAMDLIFGFLATELKSWIDSALTLDSM